MADIMANDDDKTVILPRPLDEVIRMPAPGGQATVVLKRPYGDDQPFAALRHSALASLNVGANPLLVGAAVLLALVPKLRGTGSHTDLGQLRRDLLAHIEAFGTLAAEGGVPAHQIGAARYLLCSFLDEVIEATPWGAEGGWTQRGLLQEFHTETWGGEKAFKLLERLSTDVARNRHLLELFYICLTLGFEGRFRGSPDARQQVDLLAERVLELVHPAKDHVPTRRLSLRWQGERTLSDADLGMVPLWAIASLGGAVCVALCMWLNAWLDGKSEPLLRQLHDLPAALYVTRPAVPARPRLAPVLKADVQAHAIEVRDEAQRSIVTVPADGLFVGGSARVRPDQLALLGRIAAALKVRSGLVVVSGHTDSAVPEESLKYASNWELSRDRARAVLAALEGLGISPDRARAEGRADAEPRGVGGTSPPASMNRRVEIELQLARPGG